MGNPPTTDWRADCPRGGARPAAGGAVAGGGQPRRVLRAAAQHRAAGRAAEALIPTLEDGGRPWDRELARTFMDFTNDLDRGGGRSLAELEPELMTFFAEAGLPLGR